MAGSAKRTKDRLSSSSVNSNNNVAKNAAGSQHKRETSEKRRNKDATENIGRNAQNILK